MGTNIFESIRFTLTILQRAYRMHAGSDHATEHASGDLGVVWVYVDGRSGATTKVHRTTALASTVAAVVPSPATSFV